MTVFSPNAQSVWNAFLDHSEWEVTDTEVRGIAAALRALAKQSTFADTRVGVTEEVVLVDDILKIATELEQI